MNDQMKFVRGESVREIPGRAGVRRLAPRAARASPILAWAALVALVLPINATAGPYNEEQALARQLYEKRNALGEEIRCFEGGGSPNWNQVCGHRYVRPEPAGKDEFVQRGAELGKDPARLSDTFEACSRSRQLVLKKVATTAKGQMTGKGVHVDLNYCRLYLHKWEAESSLQEIWANPWLGNPLCHIRRDYILSERPPDGCSLAPGDKSGGPFRDLFRDACAAHALDYATPGTSRPEADARFLQNMLQTCGRQPWYAVPLCESTARAWYGRLKTEIDQEAQTQYNWAQDWALFHCGGE